MTATTISWSEARQALTDKFGEPPRDALLEQVIYDAFLNQPVAVLRAAELVAKDLHDGKIRHGWPILKARLEERRGRLPDVSVDVTSREARVRQAEALLRNVGCYYDSPRRVVELLFGEGGRLYRWRDDRLLRQQMLGLWAGLVGLEQTSSEETE